MNFWVADPGWGVWIIGYFFFGGLAAGSYFLAILIDWFGSKEDRDLTRIAYLLAFPLLLLCTVFLIIDLDRPERFWHMLFKSEVMKEAFASGFPTTSAGWGLFVDSFAFKYWSPMSLGSWGLMLFGLCTFISFLGALWPKRRIGRWLGVAWVQAPVHILGCVAGFFIASYTGALLSASNQPMWSDTTWLGALFLASAASTSLAMMLLIANWKKIGSPAARTRLASAEMPALGLELVILGAFLASLGDVLGPVLQTVRGNLLVFGTLILGILLPLLLLVRIGPHRRWTAGTAAVSVLVGGLILRIGVVTTPGEILERGPAVGRFSPELGRKVGGAGADIGNRGETTQPRSKLPVE